MWGALQQQRCQVLNRGELDMWGNFIKLNYKRNWNTVFPSQLLAPSSTSSILPALCCSLTRELSWIPEPNRTCWRPASSKPCWCSYASASSLKKPASLLQLLCPNNTTVRTVTNFKLNQQLTNADTAFLSQPSNLIILLPTERKRKTETQQSCSERGLCSNPPPSGTTSLQPSELPGETLLFPVIWGWCYSIRVIKKG